MKEFVYRTHAGSIHRSLRERRNQSIGELARWLRIPASAVFKVISGDDRMGWRGYPDSDLENVMVTLVTKEAIEQCR